MKEEKKVLTGIERQLVLEYLIDGNVPVTLTEFNDINSDENADSEIENDSNSLGDTPIKKISSGVFPVAIKSEQMKVLDQGIILLQNPAESLKEFAGKKVKVQFYFNRLGLYFITVAKTTSSGLALVIPVEIFKIEDEKTKKTNSFGATIYYETGSKNGGIDIECKFDESYKLFTVPKWSDVPEEKQQEAKTYIEKAVTFSKQTGIKIGNGLFLISISRYLSENPKNEQQSISGRAESPKIIYIDHERIIFAARKQDMILSEQHEYALCLSFPIAGPVRERKVYLTCKVEKIWESEDSEKKCASSLFTSIKEEDERFLYEKTRE